MIIKKFVGKTEEEAVEAAKKELGEGIVIMNVKQAKAKGFFAAFRAKQIEVTVALEEEPVKQVIRDVPKSSVKNEGAGSAAFVSSNDIEKKLDSLQTLLESQLKRNEGSDAAGRAEETEEPAPAKAEKAKEKEEEDGEQEKFLRLLYNTMIDNEVDEKYANMILDEVDKCRKPGVPLDYVLANIYQKMILKFSRSDGITPTEKGPRIVFFIGPTGVGKTTTIAKLASQYIVNEKKKTALLTADTYRIAAAEQLRTYAGILEVPFRIIYTEEELCAAVDDFRDYDYVFVDTAGHSHQNEKQMEKMKSMFHAVKAKADTQAFLVLSATTKYRDLKKITDSYRELSDFELIFTKLDETATLGNLLNLKLHTDTPIAYVTFGQDVPDDIERFNPQKIVKQILGGKL